MRISINKNFAELVLLGIFFSHLARIITGEKLYLGAAIFFSFCAIPILPKALVFSKSAKFFLLLLCSSLLVTYHSYGFEIAFKNTLYLSSAAAAALVMLVVKRYYKIPLMAFYGFCFAIITSSFFSEPDYLEWVSGSRNQLVPLLMFLFTCSLFLRKTDVEYSMHKYAFRVFYPSVLLAICSVLTVSLAGIITSFLFYFGTALHFLYLYRSKRAVMLFLISALAASLIFTNNIIVNAHHEVIDKLTDLSGSASDLTQLSRLEIWLDYVSSADALLGGSYLQPYGDKFNLHNSYLLAHAKFGINAILFLLLMLCSFVRMLQQEDLSIIFPLFFVCFALRGATDTLFFSGSSYTFLLFAFVFKAFFEVSDEWRIENKNFIDKNPRSLGVSHESIY